MKFSSIRKFDAYARAEEHLTTQTISGAIVSVTGFILMITLFCSELTQFWEPLRVHEMTVDATRDEKLQINLNMTFPRLPCSLLSLDALDMSGKHEVDIEGNLRKIMLRANGSQLLETEQSKRDRLREISQGAQNNGPFGGANQNVVKRIQESLREMEGCNVAGRLEVQRVAGNFHVSVHSQSFHVLEAIFRDARDVNVSHVIHTLSFGPEFPGAVNPLDDTQRILEQHEGSGTYKYFLKVVPTTYSSLKEPEIPTNQFSVTEYYMPATARGSQLPAVYFMYDLFPITVSISEGKRSLGHFLTRVCAVVGGVFAVSGMLDRFIHRVVKQMESKST